jgi:hypothetical protein
MVEQNNGEPVWGGGEGMFLHIRLEFSKAMSYRSTIFVFRSSCFFFFFILFRFLLPTHIEQVEKGQQLIKNSQKVIIIIDLRINKNKIKINISINMKNTKIIK